ncbi:MAG: glyoxalase/bleomycin resistance/dioxygenase family protein [Alphaproteobacteria bacterium]|nr:glyoxalase/bleomycin resistance/dioxygenase family protein [Alphaproteobacteria bacterium]
MQATAPAGSITGLGQIHISVSDIDRAVAFYRDVLGLKFLFQVPGQPMAFFDCGGVRLYLGVPTSPEYKANSFLYYRVNDIGAAYERLAGNGVAFLGEPRAIRRTENSELWMAGFRDPDGNYAQIMEEKPR